MRKRTFSVRSRIIALMLLCWLIPLVLIVAMNLSYLTGERLEGKFSKELERLQYSDQSNMRRLERAVESSRDASYDGTVIRLYRDYAAGQISRQKLLADSTYYIRDKYSSNEAVQVAVLWFREDPEALYSNIYNTREGATYTQVQQYWNEDHEAIAALTADLDTRTAFYLAGDRLYLVRNLCTPRFEPAAALVFRLNTAYCFQSYTSLPAGTAVTVQLDEIPIHLSGTGVTEEETGLTTLGGVSGYRWDQGKLRLFHRLDTGEHSLTSLVRYEDNSAFTPFQGLSTVFVLMALCIIPLILALLAVFYHHITRPIRKMMEGAVEIERGNLGYQLDFEPDSTEFRYLADSFNTMSSRLEYQFHHIYEEELALRDARIQALQAHINPHFMNNTLEIINWEARMAGNDKVSEMIEALATLMNAGIDRHRQTEIPLSEEMEYVNAYLYIISQRLGKRLTILNELPEDIMDCKVPRLILQPVIENAVEHGAVRTGTGTVMLYGYREGDFLRLEIMNDAVMTPEEQDRVALLLSDDYDTARASSANLGIANVNQRLRILYGAGSGLSLEQVDNRHVRARLSIRQTEQENADS